MEEITIEEAMKRFGKNAKVLVANQDLEKPEQNLPFAVVLKSEYKELFSDVKTIAAMCDDFVNKYNLYTEKQDIFNISPVGLCKIVLLRE